MRDHTTATGVAEWATAITTGLRAELASSLPSIADIEAALAHITMTRFPDTRPYQ